MATANQTELEVFHRFLGDRLNDGKRDLTVEETVEAFRAYQRDLQQLRQEIRPALERSLRGESKPFDAEELKDRVTRQLAEEGITD